MQLIVEASAHLHNHHTLPPRKRLWLFILHIFPVIITSKAYTFRIKQDEITEIWTALHSSSSGNGPWGGFCENTNKLCIPQEAQSFLTHWAIAYITSNCSVKYAYFLLSFVHYLCEDMSWILCSETKRMSTDLLWKKCHCTFSARLVLHRWQHTT